AQPARRAEHHYLRDGDVYPTPPLAAATARPADVQAVAIRARIIPAAAVDLPGRAAAAVDAAGIPAAAHPRDESLNAAARSRRGNRRENVLTHGLLGADALHVDDRRLARDRNRLFERADLQVGIDRRHEGAADLDPFALDGAEAGQGKRHRIGPGQE